MLSSRAPAWYCAITCGYSSNRETSVPEARATSQVLQNPRWPVAATLDRQRTFSPTQKLLTEQRCSRVTKFTVWYWLSFTNSLVFRYFHKWCFVLIKIAFSLNNTILWIHAFLSESAEATYGMKLSFRYHQPRMLHKICSNPRRVPLPRVYLTTWEVPSIIYSSPSCPAPFGTLEG